MTTLLKWGYKQIGTITITETKEIVIYEEIACINAGTYPIYEGSRIVIMYSGEYHNIKNMDIPEWFYYYEKQTIAKMKGVKLTA